MQSVVCSQDASRQGVAGAVPVSCCMLCVCSSSLVCACSIPRHQAHAFNPFVLLLVSSVMPKRRREEAAVVSREETDDRAKVCFCIVVVLGVLPP